MGNWRGKGGDDLLQRREFRLARTALTTAALLLVLVGVAANRDDVVQAQRLATVSVIIRSNGAERQVRTAQTTVGATLKEAGVEVGPLDKVTPATSERISDGTTITVVHVNDAIEVERKPIAFDSVKRFTTSLRPGKVQVTSNGVQGEKLVRYVVRYEDGKPVSRTLIGTEVVKKPVSQVTSIGSRGRYTSRGDFHTRKVISMIATAYEPSPRSCGRYATGRTSSGLLAGYGVVAVDPKVIPLGTKLYVEGYGYAIAGDQGRSIQGNRIDLGFATVREAMSFGRRSVIVHILDQQ